MWISKLELTRFKSYSQATLEFPEPSDGKNIVLIGGMNGYGKTTILESIYLCLYGKDAIIHLARAGLKSDDKKGYPTFLERALNGEARWSNRDTSMSVRVTINFTKTKAVDIHRSWYFRKNGTWTEEEVTVREIFRDIPGAPRKDGQNGFILQDYLNERFVPAHIAPFFFFDGEEVKKLADQTRIEQVKQGLEGLLGVVILRSLSDRLKQFENNKRVGVSNVDETKLQEKQERLEKEEGTLKQIEAEKASDTTRLNQLKAEREKLIEIIASAGGAGGDIATVKDLVEEREQYRSELKNCHQKLESLMRDRLPFNLVPIEIVDTYRNQIIAEQKFLDWNAEKKTLEPKWAHFQERFFSSDNEEIRPPLQEAQVLAVKSRLEKAWASLFFPPPPDCAQYLKHSYLGENSRADVLNKLNKIQLSQNDITSILARQKQLEESIEKVNRKINQIEGIDKDGTLEERRRSLKETDNSIESLAEEIQTLDRKLIAKNAELENLRAECEKGRRALDESSPARNDIRKSEKVRAVIDELIPSLFPLKVKELARAMTSVYKQLAHKTQVQSIEIDNDGTTRIKSNTGAEVDVDRSAGENQIFATALIAGLAKVSKVKAPMVVDTPLGRLDSEHRKNILDFWTSDSNRQVILLSQDEEIDFSFFRQIQDKVSKTYLLEHLEIGDGIGRTSAKADQYFKRGRK